MNTQQPILFRILSLSNRVSRRFDSLNIQRIHAGVSGANARILNYLATHDDEHIYQKDLEREFSIRRSTISKIVQLMEAKGLLRRESVPQDARLKRLLLTDKARSIHSVAAEEIKSLEERVTSVLTPEEKETFLRLLAKLDSTLD
ncbi:MAG: MarR family transcriptional regulator [Christensenellales bacterium]|nr:MarR family transcriptional regulator [Christensenellales bacterium]